MQKLISIIILFSFNLHSATVEEVILFSGIEDIRREINQLKTSTGKSEVYTKYFTYKRNTYTKINPDIFIEQVSKVIREKYPEILNDQIFTKFKSPFFLKFLNLINERIRLDNLVESIYQTNSLIVDQRRAKQIDNFINFFGIKQIIRNEKKDLEIKIKLLQEKRRSIQLAQANEMDIEIKRLQKILRIFDERSIAYITKQLSKIRYTEFIQLFTAFNDKDLKQVSSFIIYEVYALLKKAQN